MISIRVWFVATSLFVCIACSGDNNALAPNPAAPSPTAQSPAAPSPTAPSPSPIPTVPVNLLVNGSLENGPAIPSTSSYTTLRGGSTAIPGWVVTGSSIDYIGSVHPPSDGRRAVDLDGAFSTGGISQTFATTPGSRYVVTFDLSGNPEGAPRVKVVRVAVGGFVRDYSFETDGQNRTNLRWEAVSFAFVASGTTAVLSFASLSPASNSWGALIDRVAVVTG